MTDEPTVIEATVVDDDEPEQTAELATTTPKALVPLSDMPITYATLKALYTTPTVPARYRNSKTGVNDMLAAVLVGKEVGIGPMEAINSIYMVNGQIAMSGKLLSALIHRAGHQIRLDIKPKEVTATGFRRDYVTHELTEVGSITFSEQDAKRAKLHEKDTYRSYPQILWSWRAISALARFYFADVVTGMAAYVPEELNISVEDAPIEAIPVDDVDVTIDSESLEIANATAEVIDVLDAEVIGK